MKFFWQTSVLLIFCIKTNSSENFTLSLLYPLTDVQEMSFFYYASAFTMAVDNVNEHSSNNTNNITFIYTMDDTNANRTKNTYNTIEKVRESLKIIARRSVEKYDAFIGPGFKTCSCQAQLAAAYNVPLIGYVSNIIFTNIYLFS